MNDGRYKPFELGVLTQKVFSYKDLMKVWGTQSRDINAALHKFHVINSKYLKFLDISSRIIDDNGETKIELTSSKYIGCVPTLSPRGRFAGNIIVEGRFKEDIAELLSMIGESPLLEYDEDFKLTSGAVKNPPLYFECMKYIDKYIDAKKIKWRKFESREIIEKVPSASTNWRKYALNSINPNNRFVYPNQKNILTKDHLEWAELNYVLNLAIDIILSPDTPMRSRLVYMQKITSLQKSFDKKSVRYVKSIQTRMSDPEIIKELKDIGNRILQSESHSNCAWRIDFAEFFEKYVQFIMKEISRQKNAKVYCNPKYSIRGNKPIWTLQYIEPDVVIDKDNAQYIIDAKYKSHMYNLASATENLKETFRQDFFQVLAYSSFNKKAKKNVMLVYPAAEYKVRLLNISSSINDSSTNAYLVGIPLKKSEFEETKANLSQLISFSSN